MSIRPRNYRPYLLALWASCCISEVIKAETVVLHAPIVHDTVWKAQNTYIISDDVHIKMNVALSIENGAKVCILNGPVPKTSLINRTGRSTLIFDSGSKLNADVFELSACDSQANPLTLADNGGLVFLGTRKSSQKIYKDHVTNNQNSPFPSKFKINTLVMNYLGSEDSKPIWSSSTAWDKPRIIDDWDSLTFIGVNTGEWVITNQIISNNSGQNGVDFINSRLTIQSLSILTPIEDGINMTSSYVTITRNLSNLTYVSKIFDRDLFDFEVHYGAASLVVNAGAAINLDGILGDQVKLRSTDCPPQNPVEVLTNPSYICHVPALMDNLTVTRIGAV
jgi:hypothetical protein